MGQSEKAWQGSDTCGRDCMILLQEGLRPPDDVGKRTMTATLLGWDGLKDPVESQPSSAQEDVERKLCVGSTLQDSSMLSPEPSSTEVRHRIKLFFSTFAQHPGVRPPVREFFLPIPLTAGSFTTFPMAYDYCSNFFEREPIKFCD